MPNAQLWSILFFLMLLTLGIDTQFGMLEGVVTPILDAKWFPNVRIEVLTGMSCHLSKKRVYFFNFEACLVVTKEVQSLILNGEWRLNVLIPLFDSSCHLPL